MHWEASRPSYRVCGRTVSSPTRTCRSFVNHALLSTILSTIGILPSREAMGIRPRIYTWDCFRERGPNACFFSRFQILLKFPLQSRPTHCFLRTENRSICKTLNFSHNFNTSIIFLLRGLEFYNVCARSPSQKRSHVHIQFFFYYALSMYILVRVIFSVNQIPHPSGITSPTWASHSHTWGC